MTEERGIVELPSAFAELPEGYFSLGQSENYYESIFQLYSSDAKRYFESMRDCAYNLRLYDLVKDEPVMVNSLMREISSEQVKNRFHQLSLGNAMLSGYNFSYEFPESFTAPGTSPTLTFEVRPNSAPPSNIHVLIGRNGVGKTRCFRLMSDALLAGEDNRTAGRINKMDNLFASANEAQWFAGLVNVSFSAFDATAQLSHESFESGLKYAYVGLKKIISTSKNSLDRNIVLKDHAELANDFVASVELCREGIRLQRWIKALKTLEADPLFQEADVSSLGYYDDDDNWRESATKLFRNLSSGHGIVLLTMTRLVALIEERSLVLIDEPEGHLHPPLLSAFIRALSDLLIDRNGVAIIATHSPVVLQEVPTSCVWVLSRSGSFSRADRPELETFGENVGILTREVFGLEVTQSGFHKMISDYASIHPSYDDVIRHFDGSVGAEGRALARTLTASMKN